MTEIDWASLQKEAEDVLVPDGEYPLIVLDATATQASTGKPMIKLVLAIIEGPKKDRKIYTQLTLSPENPVALKMWFQQLAAFGIGPEFFATKPTMEQLATALKNRGVVAKIGQREWQGSNRNNVESYKMYVPTGPIPPGLVLGAPIAGPVASLVTPGPVIPGSTNGPVASPVPTTPITQPVPPSAPPKDPF